MHAGMKVGGAVWFRIADPFVGRGTESRVPGSGWAPGGARIPPIASGWTGKGDGTGKGTYQIYSDVFGRPRDRGVDTGPAPGRLLGPRPVAIGPAPDPFSLSARLPAARIGRNI